VSRFVGSTLTIEWLSMPDGTYLAKCASEPAWKYVAGSYDEEAKAAAQISLKRHHSRGICFEHMVWPSYIGAAE
jgi:hypothetical protein